MADSNEIVGGSGRTPRIRLNSSKLWRPRHGSHTDITARLALDHPDRVDRLVIFGGVPIGEALARCDSRFATAWHWFFMGQPNAMAERLVAADVEAWYRLDRASMVGENYADVAAAVSRPAVQHAMCEDYRAGLGVDRDADDADCHAARQVHQRLLVVWGAKDDVSALRRRHPKRVEDVGIACRGFTDRGWSPDRRRSSRRARRCTH